MDTDEVLKHFDLVEVDGLAHERVAPGEDVLVQRHRGRDGSICASGIFDGGCNNQPEVLQSECKNVSFRIAHNVRK